MRNKYKSIFIIGLLLILGMMACEYDTETPFYYQDHAEPPVPVITSVEPAETAGPGTNTIVINGENFAASREDNVVYFDGVAVDVKSASATQIEVRRPNIVTESSTIKVVSNDALVVAKHPDYAVTAVQAPYGGFLEGLRLSALTVDQNETMYVVQRTPRTVYKILADGTKTVLGEASKIVTDLKFTPEGNLLLLINNKSIMQMNVETGVETEWTALAKKVSFGDFDQNGILYCAGKKSDLWVVQPDLSGAGIGVYANYEVFSVRIFDNTVYILAENTKAGDGDVELGIWKHAILDGAGALGPQELLLDWSMTGDYAESNPLNINFDADGILYIGTNHTQPLMMLLPDGTQDIFYKDIIQGTIEMFVWGSGNNAYQLKGTDTWDIIQIDMGVTGAPAFDR